MHRSSFARMQAFRDAYLADLTGRPLKVLDVGAAAVDGGLTYRKLFTAPGWSYLGLDTGPLANVDLAVHDPYHWRELADSSFDVIVSGQAFEHIDWPWLTIMEIARVLRPGGLAAITAPSSGHVHRFPSDCWRYYPDGFPALAKYAGLSVVENDVDFGYAFNECAVWGDAFAILQKPLLSDDEARNWSHRRKAARLAAGRTDDANTDLGAAGPAAPFDPKLPSRNALSTLAAAELKSVAGPAWRWRLALHHLRAASRALRYPAELIRRF